MATLRTLLNMLADLKKPPPNITCSSCAHAKQKPSPHKPNTKTYKVGSYVSLDTCGPFTPTSRHGNRHFLTFIDAASRYLILYFIKDRREVSLILPAMFSCLIALRGRPPQIYRTDNAKEFCSKSSKTTYSKHGIEHRTTTPHQPQENSRAERINQTLLNAARAALHHANLDDTFWEDATRDAAFKYHVMLHSALEESPYEQWHGHKPHTTKLFSFGQKGHITVHSPKKKLQPRAVPAQYMYGTSDSQICVLNLHTQQYHTVRTNNFHPYVSAQDHHSTSTGRYKAHQMVVSTFLSPTRSRTSSQKQT